MSRSQRFKLKAKEVNYSGLDRVLSILQWCALLLAVVYSLSENARS